MCKTGPEGKCHLDTESGGKFSRLGTSLTNTVNMKGKTISNLPERG
jgi:hypothetical protein